MSQNADEGAAYVFLDANILLHFKPPQEIDWCRLCSTATVHLVIYPRLRTEVSNAKDMKPQKHLRKRAGEREAWLRERLKNVESPIRPGVFLRRETTEPRDILTELYLRPDVSDDLIVALAVSYQWQSRNVFVVTADSGLEMKLEDQSIKVLVLDDALRLAAEPDPDRLRAEVAERQLRDHQNRLPKLTVTSLTDLQIPILPSLPLVEEFVEDRLQRADRAIRSWDRELALENHGKWPISEYDLHAHAPAARSYLRALHAWYSAIHGARMIVLVVANDGAAAANNIRVSLEFPGGVRLQQNGAFVRPISWPLVGSPYRGLFEDSPDSENMVTESAALVIDISGNLRILADPFRVKAAAARLAHHARTHFGKFFLIAEQDAPCGSSAIRCTTLCDEWAEPEHSHIPFTIFRNEEA